MRLFLCLEKSTLNRTNLEHAYVALLIMAAFHAAFFFLGLPLGHWVGFVAGAFFFLGREYTQAEREIAKARGVTILSLSWYTALDFRLWSRDARLDLMFPVAACLGAALLVELLRLLMRSLM